ncbi:sulfotransferase 1E1 [Rhipicephalus sanguineus]|uniref:sulfotransferase 1E1 n=1 Tax=Rhipicephalus sanguineus TaxID=34632 RepID=UPI001893CDA8|nr:sulfotransferase 1E1 [Rhipicephalus sanguineus]
MNLECYKYVDGVSLHGWYHEDVIRSALSYKPRSDDIFIVTYPKSGTTWMQYVILSILGGGEVPRTFAEYALASPYLELLGAESVERMPRPGLIKTHLPFHKAPYSPEAKYICAARNVYDVCVSYYYHTRGLTPISVKDVSFATFHDMITAGKLSYGDYFDHVLSWYEHRHHPNVLFFTYEDVKKDPQLWVMNIAEFLGKEYAQALKRDPELLLKVISASSLTNMKQIFTETLSASVLDLLSLPSEKGLKSLQVYRDIWPQIGELHKNEDFVRKGVIGDWKEHFTPELIEKTKAWIERKTMASDVMELWKDIELP